MTNRVLQAVQNLQTAAAGPAEREALRNRGHGFIRRILQRHQGVARQLAGNESPVLAVTKDTPVGAAGWMQEDSGSGTAQFARVDLEGLKTLQIKTGAVSSVASWRKGVLLAPGAYKFQARVRVHNPSGNLRAGAALRISGVSGGRLLPQAAQWQTIEFPFNVRETAPDVVLICEVRGAEVEALFDIDSLRLSP